MAYPETSMRFLTLVFCQMTLHPLNFTKLPWNYFILTSNTDNRDVLTGTPNSVKQLLWGGHI